MFGTKTTDLNSAFEKLTKQSGDFLELAARKNAEAEGLQKSAAKMIEQAATLQLEASVASKAAKHIDALLEHDDIATVVLV